MALYHKDIGLPKGFKAAVGLIHCTPTRHAIEASKTDRYGSITLPSILDTDKDECIEVELEDREVFKLVYRIAYDNFKDLVLAVVPRNGQFIIKTVWFNLKSDEHRTLNRARYCVPK